MRPNAYTDAEISKVREMRMAGKSWREVAAAIGRKEKAVYSKFFSLGETQPKKPQTFKKKITKKIVASIPAPTRPMVAFIGTPQEITASIRELFS